MKQIRVDSQTGLNLANDLNVLMVDAAYPPPIIGGKEKQAHLLAKELVRRGASVKALSYRHNGNANQIHDGISIERIGRGLFTVPKIAWKLLKLRPNFNILHVHTPSRFGGTVAIIGKLLRYKVVFKFPNEGKLACSNLSNRLWWKVILKNLNLFIALEKDTEMALKRSGVSSDKIFLISNGVLIDTELKIDRDYHSSNKIVLLYVGRLVSQKGVDVLLKACAQIPTSNIDWSLVAIGSGPELSNLTQQASDLGISDRITLLGNQDNPLRWMKSADILVSSSHKEGMSNVILEAMSIGLPVIATDVGASRHQLGELGRQFISKPADPSDLSKKIALLACNHTARAEYGSYLRKRALDCFSIAAIADKYIAKYREIR